MLRLLIVLSCVAAIFAFPTHPRFLHGDATEFIPDEYIIMLNATATSRDLEILASRFDAFFRYEIHTGFKGFAAKLTGKQLTLALDQDFVSHIEPNQIYRTQQGGLRDCSQSEQQVSWGQDRVTAPSPRDLDLTLHHGKQDGKNVNLYIIDTGIQIEHDDFKPNRAIWGFNAVAGSSDTDKNGHGTHVASTAGGNQWGFAKNSDIYAVKVLGDNGSGSTAGVIAGVNYAAEQATSLKGKKRCVGNMSLGGGLSTALDTATNNAVDAGLAMVVAAGNDNNNACFYSPARAAKAISVGATTQGFANGEQIDQRSSFSNWGTCVDIMAPGQLITAAWIGASNSVIHTISGTSMASPHVAGISAVVLGDNPDFSVTDLREWLLDNAQPGVALACGSSSGCLQTPTVILHRDCPFF